MVAVSTASHLANVRVAPCRSPAGQLPSYGGDVILPPTPNLKQLWLFWALILSLSLSKKERSGEGQLVKKNTSQAETCIDDSTVFQILSTALLKVKGTDLFFFFC